MDEPPPPGEEAKSSNEAAKEKGDFESDGEGDVESEQMRDSSKPKDEDKAEEITEVKDNKDQDGDIIEVENRRRDMHKTSSIFLRNLAPSITKAEVEAVSDQTFIKCYLNVICLSI